MALCKDIRIKFSGAPAFMDYATGTWFREDCWLDELPAEVQICVCQYLAPMVPDYKVYWANVNFVAKTLADNLKAKTPVPPGMGSVLLRLTDKHNIVTFFHKVSAIVDPEIEVAPHYAGYSVSDHICNQARGKLLMDAWAGPGHYERLMEVPYIHSDIAMSEYKVIAESVSNGAVDFNAEVNKVENYDGFNPIWVCLQRSSNSKSYGAMESVAKRSAVSPDTFWDGICETLGCYDARTSSVAHTAVRDDPYWFIHRHDSPCMDTHLWGQVHNKVYRKGVMPILQYFKVNQKTPESRCHCMTAKGKKCCANGREVWSFTGGMRRDAHLGLAIDYELGFMRRELAVIGKVGKKPIPFHMTRDTGTGVSLPNSIEFCGKHKKMADLFDNDPKVALRQHIKSYGYTFNKHGYVVYKGRPTR